MSDNQDCKTIVFNAPSNEHRRTREKPTQFNQPSYKNKNTANKQRKPLDNYRKIDQAEECNKVVTVSIDIARTIQQARNSKGYTQKQLAIKINEQSRVIADYETGKAIPNNQILGKLERVLDVKLRSISTRH